jgi:hypothetical protein
MTAALNETAVKNIISECLCALRISYGESTNLVGSNVK